MAKIIRIIARPTGASYTRHMHKLLDSSCIKPTRPITMVSLAPSVTRVPVKVASRKPAPLHVHTSHYFEGHSSVLEILDNACAAGLPINLTNHSNHDLSLLRHTIGR